MPPLLLALVLLGAPRVQLVNDVFRVPAEDWRYVDFSLRPRAALVTAECRSAAGSAPVRIALLRREDLDRLRAGEAHSVIEATPVGLSNHLDYLLREPGDYALVIDNEERAPASVHLSVWLDFAQRPPALPQITPVRRMAVILISFAVFFLITGLTARKLLRALHSPPHL